MTHLVSAALQIKPHSAPIATSIAALSGLAGLLFAGDSWRTTGSVPGTLVLIFGLPTLIFALLAWVAHARSLELRGRALYAISRHGARCFELIHVAGISVRTNLYGRTLSRQLVLWSNDRREYGVITFRIIGLLKFVA